MITAIPRHLLDIDPAAVVHRIPVHDQGAVVVYVRDDMHEWVHADSDGRVLAGSADGYGSACTALRDGLVLALPKG
jgi:hypothetical protein